VVGIVVETRIGTYQTRVANVTVICMSPGRAYRKQIQQYRQFNVHNYEYNFKANVIISRNFLCRCKAVGISQIKVPCSLLTADLT